MSELESTLTRLSHEFASAVITALKALPVEALYEDIDLAPAPKAAKKAKTRLEAATPRASSTVKEVEEEDENEVSILEHLNEAGPTGSTVRAWVISTQGELPQHEHDQLEREANAILDRLEARGLIQKRAFSKSRGQVYALAPV